MSHRAVHWAMEQRDLRPSTWRVLMLLADRHNPDHGCFPSLELLAHDCGMSRRSVQDQLGELEKRGLIRIEKMPRQAGRLPSNRYRLACEPDFGKATSQAETAGKGAEKTPSAKFAQGKSTSTPWAKSRRNLGQNLPPNLVREPVKKPRTEPERQALSCIEVTEEGLGLSRWTCWLAAHGLPPLADIPAFRRGAMRGGYMLPSRIPPDTFDTAKTEKVLAYLREAAGLEPLIAEKRFAG